MLKEYAFTGVVNGSGQSVVLSTGVDGFVVLISRLLCFNPLLEKPTPTYKLNLHLAPAKAITSTKTATILDLTYVSNHR